MCFHNLLRRKARTFLCIFGIAIAIMFIIAVGATSSRYIAVLKEMNLFFTGDVVVVARGVIVIQAFPIGGALHEDTVETLRPMNGVQAAIPMLFIPNPSETDGVLQLMPQNVTIGMPLEDRSVLIGSAPLKPDGRWPSTDSSLEVVVGPSLAYNYNLTAGSVVNIRDQKLTVTGVLETRSALLSRTILMSLKLAQKTYRYNMLVNMIVVRPKNGVSSEDLASKIEFEIEGVKALTDSERNELLVPVVQEAELFNMGIRTILFMMSFMLIAAISMMNMFERRRDFATLHAIGASKFSIIRMVITETSLLGFFGGILGIVLGAITSVLIVSYYTAISPFLIFPDILTIVPPYLMTEILISTVALASIAGVIPAIAIGRTRIEEILRSEY